MHDQVWTPRLLMCWRSPVERYRWRMRSWGRAHVRDFRFVFKSAKRTLGKRAPLHAILLPSHEILDRAPSMAMFDISTQWKVLYLNLPAQESSAKAFSYPPHVKSKWSSVSSIVVKGLGTLRPRHSPRPHLVAVCLSWKTLESHRNIPAQEFLAKVLVINQCVCKGTYLKLKGNKFK